MFLRKRIEQLEASMGPRSRRICIWGMKCGEDLKLRLKTNQEIAAEVNARRHHGTIGANDQVIVAAWQMD